jgi:hypothetical protein
VRRFVEDGRLNSSASDHSKDSSVLRTVAGGGRSTRRFSVCSIHTREEKRKK